MMGGEEFQTWCAGYGEVGDWGRGLGPDWLSRAEHAELAHWRDPGRRKAWQASRFMAKRMILDRLTGVTRHAREIEILAQDGRGRPMRPHVVLGGRRMPWSLSISHTSERVWVALSTARGISLGVDLTPLGPSRDGFVRTWLTPAEQAALRSAPPDNTAVFWAVKEAVYKACNAGEKFAPTRVEVRRTESGFGCTYCGVDLADAAEIESRECPGHVAILVRVNLARYGTQRNPEHESAPIDTPKISR